jgi:hypothetical protein
MQVQYQLDLDDIVAFGLHHARASKDSRRRLRLTQLWGVIFALFVALMWLRWGVGTWTILFTGYSLFMLFGYPSFCQWSVKHNTRKIYSEGQNKGALGNHIIALDAEGVTEISDVGESRIAWVGIEKVEENEEYVFLYTGSLQAHVIPKRAFLSGGEATEFFKLAQAYHSGR